MQMSDLWLRYGTTFGAYLRGTGWGLFKSRFSTRKLCRYFGIPLQCQHCGRKSHIAFRASRTAYAEAEGTELKDSPNRPVLLCNPCAAEHDRYWDDMWDEYHYSRM